MLSCPSKPPSNAIEWEPYSFLDWKFPESRNSQGMYFIICYLLVLCTSKCSVTLSGGSTGSVEMGRKFEIKKKLSGTLSNGLP